MPGTPTAMANKPVNAGCGWAASLAAIAAAAPPATMAASAAWGAPRAAGTSAATDQTARSQPTTPNLPPAPIRAHSHPAAATAAAISAANGPVPP